MSYDLPALCTQVRRDILEMTHAAGSGHPGGSLSAVEILVSLYFDQMKLDPAVMASPFISTIVDATSLLIYFRFASWLLL